MESGAALIQGVGVSNPQDNPYVRFQNQNEMGQDFSSVLENVRARASTFQGRMEKIADSQTHGLHNSAQMKQLVDLYSYAVDTQLLVRTSNQLITGMRQLMTGQ